MGVDGVDEAGDHVGPGHAVVGGGGQQVSGVVVEPVEDLDFTAIGQLPVGEIGLPALVGLGGFKSVVGAAWTFTWLGGDQPVVVQDAPDRRRRGHGQAGLVQVELQSERTGIESLVDETFSQPHDGDDDVVRHRARVAGRPSRAGVNGLQAALAVALE